ncbi:MAG: methyl-accepting chemotaxis protein [Lachnospiraceae bacterium]|nr:methyl-accepting chemotaxis protein [Lachnospiraceae bacterium]MCX4319108.1 HAMP domain-containing methyl-accepting chemotaxis protein [Lachnospiraceae bacterium]
MKKKKFSIHDMAVRSKLIMFSTILIILMVFISGVGLWFSFNINKARTASYNNYAIGKFLVSESYSCFADVKVRLRNAIYIYSDNPEKLEEQINQMEEYKLKEEQNFADFETRLPSLGSDIESQYHELDDRMNAYIATADSIIALVKEGKIAEAQEELTGNGVAVADAVEENLMTLMDTMEQAAEANSSLVDKQLIGMAIILVAVSVLAVVITLAYCFMLIKAITIPVRKLSKAAKQLAVGDVDVDCEKIYDDDLGELMDEFAVMAEATKEQAKVADLISQGDLTIEVNPRGDRDLLGNSLRKLLNDQNITLSNIKESGSQIAVGSDQVAHASQALAQGSTEQASALEQVTASMDEVTQRTKNNATEAGEANTLVNTIKEKAAEGNGQMKSMIEAMDSINESSETISKIIKTIDDIAFQTNILALNAAVEAARAGIHGKGFAVVAEEVRNLAAKSASAASETAEMIEDSIRKIANGTKLAEETASSLDEIVQSIDEIVGLISGITVSSSDQATAISQIDQAISQVSTVVQTNAATSEQCAAASEQLSNQAATLKALIGQYKLLATGQSSSYVDTSDNSYSDNEQVISLEGDFSKY